MEGSEDIPAGAASGCVTAPIVTDVGIPGPISASLFSATESEHVVVDDNDDAPLRPEVPGECLILNLSQGMCACTHC